MGWRSAARADFIKVNIAKAVITPDCPASDLLYALRKGDVSRGDVVIDLFFRHDGGAGSGCGNCAFC